MWIQPLGVHDAYIFYSRRFFIGNPTERQLWYYHDRFGANPRDLAGLIKLPDPYISRLIEQINRIKSADLRHLQ